MRPRLRRCAAIGVAVVGLADDTPVRATVAAVAVRQPVVGETDDSLAERVFCCAEDNPGTGAGRVDSSDNPVEFHNGAIGEQNILEERVRTREEQVVGEAEDGSEEDNPENTPGGV
jgi:hypothetical protein